MFTESLSISQLQFHPHYHVIEFEGDVNDKTDDSLIAFEDDDAADKISPIGGPSYISYTSTYAANIFNKFSERNR